MLAAWYKKQMEVKAREEGREQGREEVFMAWEEWRVRVEAWEQRKSEADREQRAFDEPRPIPPSRD